MHFFPIARIQRVLLMSFNCIDMNLIYIENRSNIFFVFLHVYHLYKQALFPHTIFVFDTCCMIFIFSCDLLLFHTNNKSERTFVQVFLTQGLSCWFISLHIRRVDVHHKTRSTFIINIHFYYIIIHFFGKIARRMLGRATECLVHEYMPRTRMPSSWIPSYWMPI